MKVKVNEIYTTNKCGDVKVIEYNGCFDIIVEFQDSTRYVCSVTSGNLRRGNIKNQYFRNVAGVGYIGEGPYKCFDFEGGRKKLSRVFNTWSNMIIRCYSAEHHLEFPSYKDNTVEDIWHNFQNFAKWYENKNVPPGFELDKDILVKGNKVYGPSQCCFVPKKINVLFRKINQDRELPTGVVKHPSKKEKYRPDFAPARRKYNKGLGSYDTVEEAFSIYKYEKEWYIKNLAEEYKQDLENKVYQALINWNVEVAD